jgi:hypothetical protein
MMRDIGYWDALAWGSLFSLLLLLAYFLFVYKRKERETEAFLCGESFEYRTPAHNFFFGFEKTLGGFFRMGKRFHSEMPNEYVAWMLAFGLIASLLLLAMFLMGVRTI